MSRDNSYMKVKLWDKNGVGYPELRGKPEAVIPKLLELCKWKLNLREEIEKTDVVVTPLFDKASVFDIPADAKVEITLKKRE